MSWRVLKIPQYKRIGTGPGSIGDEPGMEGDVILDRSTRQFCYHDGRRWRCFSSGGDDVTLSNAGSGNSLVFDGIGPDLSILSLTSATGIQLIPTANNIEIILGFDG